MVNLSVDVVGLSNIVAKLAELGTAAQVGAAEAAYKEADIILGMSEKIVPFQTGDLQSTGRVEEVADEAGMITAAVAYGNEKVDYAVIVHEDLEAKHAQGEQAKYVEQPAREEMSSGRSLERMRATMAPYLEGVAGPGLFTKAAKRFVKTGKAAL